MTDFDDILNFDPLLEAEKLTGKSYKDDRETMLMGAGLAILQNEQKEMELGLRGDSYYNISYSEYLEILADLGFQEVYSEEFVSRWEQAREQFRVFWRDGILLTTESYMGKSLNSATAYFNAEFEDGNAPWRMSLSGCLDGEAYDGDPRRYIWCGYFDAREGIRHRLAQMEGQAKFLPKWTNERIYVSLLNYMESKVDFDEYDRIREMKLTLLPEHVRQAMGLA